MTFDRLRKEWAWKPLRNCPGRYILRRDQFSGPPAALIGANLPSREYRAGKAADPVVVVPFGEGGGLISYRRPDGTYVHTLNDAEGFSRKLEQLGIRLGESESL